MNYTAFIRFAPLTTLERVNDPAWKRRGRTMYDHGALTLAPGRTSAPLLVDHGRRIGTVHTLTRYEDTDDPWLACIAEIADLPGWLRKYDTKASFAYKPAGTSHDVFGCGISAPWADQRGIAVEPWARARRASRPGADGPPDRDIRSRHRRWAGHERAYSSHLHAAADSGALTPGDRQRRYCSGVICSRDGGNAFLHTARRSHYDAAGHARELARAAGHPRR
ncbi:MAG: hypothetical protein ACRDPZ_14650 [Gaiellaceae bacterium]